MLSRKFCLVMSFVFLVLMSCDSPAPTAVPSIPTTVVTIVATPTAATTQPTATVAPTATALPLLPTPTAVPDANTDDLLAILQAEFPTDTYEGFTVMPLYAPSSVRPYWAIYSNGLRRFDVDPPPNHFLAVYTYENGRWQELARQNLNAEDEPFSASPDILIEGSVNQVGIEPNDIWLVVEGVVGAHGGTFQLLRFDGTKIHIETAVSGASPGIGYLEDLNNDNTPELILRLHDFYVYCYACGVRYLYFQVLTWDAVNQRMMEVSIQPMLMGQQGHPAYEPTNRAVELANAGLWAEALAKIEEAQAAAAAATEPTDTFTLEWDAALIRLYHDAWRGELVQTTYPLLTSVFSGDYAAALDIMRAYTPEQIFSADTPLIKGTVAENNVQWLSEYIIQQVNPALDARPDLAAAYYLRAWATFLQNPGSPDIAADLAQAAAIDPNEPLFGGTAVPTPNRIQFTPGATSADVTGQIAAAGTDVYLLGAAAGQQMSVDLFSQADDVRLEVRDSSGGWLEGQITATFWQGTLPETGDYIIRVIGGEADAEYTLVVTIPSRIEFSPGATSAQVQGDLAARESHDYILTALAGQTMNVVITSPGGNVLLTIVGADGIPLTNGLMSGASAWRGQLPATQDYIIRALGTEQPAPYTMEITIE